MAAQTPLEQRYARRCWSYTPGDAMAHGIKEVSCVETIDGWPWFLQIGCEHDFEGLKRAMKRIAIISNTSTARKSPNTLPATSQHLPKTRWTMVWKTVKHPFSWQKKEKQLCYMKRSNPPHLLGVLSRGHQDQDLLLNGPPLGAILSSEFEAPSWNKQIF